MKRRTLNIGLGLLALVLVATVVLTRKKPDAAGAPLTPLNRDAIGRIVLHHPNAPDIVLVKADGRWSLTAPVAASAESFEVGSLLGFANAETRSTLDTADVKRGELGLEAPAYSLSLDDTTLAFGDVEPLKYTRYVEVKTADGSHVATIDDAGGTATDADYSDLVSKSLLPDGAVVTGLELPGLSVTKAVSGPGWSTVPADAAASSDAVQKLVDGWRDAKSLYNQLVPKDSSGGASGDTPAPTDAPKVRVLMDAGRSVDFLVVARSPQLVLESPALKIRYTLAGSAAETLLKLPAAKAEAPAAPAAAAVPAPAPAAGTTPPADAAPAAAPAR